MGKRPHYQLTVWQKSMNLVTEIYRLTQSFPSTEQYGLTSQLRRSAVSVPSNIAEGAGRFSGKEFLNFLSITQGSLSELETQLRIAVNLGYIKADETIFTLHDEVSRLLVGLIRKLKP